MQSSQIQEMGSVRRKRAHQPAVVGRDRLSTVLSSNLGRMLEALASFGPVRLAVGNDAASVDQRIPGVTSFDHGRCANLGAGELWFQQCQDLTTVRIKETGRGCVKVDFLHEAGQPSLRVETSPIPPRERRRFRDSLEASQAVVPRARQRTESRRKADLIDRNRVRKPRARQIRRLDLFDLVAAIAATKHTVDLMVGNDDVIWSRTGLMPKPRIQHDDVSVVTGDLPLTLRAPSIAALWAICLRTGDRTISSIEAYDLSGAPAMSIFGALGPDGHEAPAWEAFVRSMA